MVRCVVLCRRLGRSSRHLSSAHVAGAACRHLQIKKGCGGEGTGTAASSSTRESGCTAAAPASNASGDTVETARDGY
jgi:hypothetical protein